jgi:hypothetical protein
MGVVHFRDIVKEKKYTRNHTYIKNSTKPVKPSLTKKFRLLEYESVIAEGW